MGLGTGFLMGSSISFLVYSLFKRQKRAQITQEADHILQVAQDNKEHKQEEMVSRIEEYKLRLIKKQGKDLETLAAQSRELQEEVEQIQGQREEELSELRKQKKIKFQSAENTLRGHLKKKEVLLEKQTELKKIKSEIVKALENKFKIDIQSLKLESQKKQLNDTKELIIQKLKEQEEDFKHDLNQRAHLILELVLSRFQYPYCSERGIKNIVFNNQSAMEQLLGSDFSKIEILEKECGVDMKVSDKDSSISVLGIDPVRRELGRASLQKISSLKKISEKEIKKIVQDTKKNLFRRIKSDGQRICRELRLKNVKDEVKNMMGALRYRYSFAQNQYFHCQEVGWLCGLLNAELKEDLFPGRRAGMFHDIGKAMDHSKEGGHAVIGADFIETHGEDKKVVHAVKAHHHDVTPDKPLDFLVIAADALSGARPGARRSTVDSYNQKVLTLEKIGKSFKGVKDTYIMSAGREIRVIVDSQKINDIKALELSQKIADKIEEECSYPGLIKVTVVRTVTQISRVQKH